MKVVGLPHSEIPGSKPVDGSPELIAVFRVLHSLPMPRHPSCARIRLARNFSLRMDLPSDLVIRVVILFNFQLSVVKDRKTFGRRRLRKQQCLCFAFDALACASVSPSLPEGRCLLRKEVIQPLVPQRLPCYDFIPITTHTLGGQMPDFGCRRLS